MFFIKRKLETEFKCIEEYTSDCSDPEIREISTIVNKTRKAVKIGTCAGEGAKYAVCGVTGVLSVGRLLTSPYATKAAVCR